MKDKTKEYIIYITLRTDSPPPSSSVGSTLPTSLLYVCSILHYLFVCITAVSAGVERLGESFLRKTKGRGGCPF